MPVQRTVHYSDKVTHICQTSVYYIETKISSGPKIRNYVLADTREEAIQKFCVVHNLHISDLERTTCIVDNEKTLI